MTTCMICRCGDGATTRAATTETGAEDCVGMATGDARWFICAFGRPARTTRAPSTTGVPGGADTAIGEALIRFELIAIEFDPGEITRADVTVGEAVTSVVVAIGADGRMESENALSAPSENDSYSSSKSSTNVE